MMMEIIVESVLLEFSTMLSVIVADLLKQNFQYIIGSLIYFSKNSI